MVVDDQVTPHRVKSLSPSPQRVSVDLAGIAWRVNEGHRLFLEVTTTSNDHGSARVPSTAHVTAAVELPVCCGRRRKSR